MSHKLISLLLLMLPVASAQCRKVAIFYDPGTRHVMWWIVPESPRELRHLRATNGQALLIAKIDSRRTADVSTMQQAVDRRTR